MTDWAMARFQFNLGNLLLAVSCSCLGALCLKFVVRNFEALDFIAPVAVVGASLGAAVATLLKGLRGAVLEGLMGGGAAVPLCLLGFIFHLLWRLL